MTDTDKLMNSQHFGSSPAVIWMWINLDSNLGSLSVEISALMESVLSECSCLCIFLWLREFHCDDYQ